MPNALIALSAGKLSGCLGWTNEISPGPLLPYADPRLPGLLGMLAILNTGHRAQPQDSAWLWGRRDQLFGSTASSVVSREEKAAISSPREWWTLLTSVVTEFPSSSILSQGVIACPTFQLPPVPLHGLRLPLNHCFRRTPRACLDLSTVLSLYHRSWTLPAVSPAAGCLDLLESQCPRLLSLPWIKYMLEPLYPARGRAGSGICLSPSPAKLNPRQSHGVSPALPFSQWPPGPSGSLATETASVLIFSSCSHL